MGQVLYRKYRSKSLDEVVGQDHITTSLQHALKSGKLAHAYLFTGPRGVGKTSVARILAYSVNNLPYSEEPQLDIIEIDAASNRRIDEIRDLRDKVNIAPTSAKYKVYIIDEVHMLTREAFNALLKTLEEPPEHVIFILATTEANKLPATIISRTQRYSFKPVAKDKVVEHLGEIANKERIKIDPAALELIAEHGEGSFRDSISILDQLRNSDERITVEAVQSALGIVPQSAIKAILQDIDSGRSTDLIRTLESQYEQGYQASVLAKQLGQQLRNQLISGEKTASESRQLRLLKSLLDVPSSAHPEKLLEIILLKALYYSRSPVDSPSKLELEKVPLETNTNPTSELASAPEQIEKKSTKLKAGNKKFDETLWPELLMTIKQKHNTLYSFLRMARPEFGKNKLDLVFGFKFHQKRLDEAKNKQFIVETIYELTGKDVEVTNVFAQGTVPYDVKSDDLDNLEAIEEIDDPTIQTINNIFGSSEVIES